MGPCPHLQASLCRYLCPLPLVPMSSFPGALGLVDTLSPPLHPTVSVPAELLFSVNKAAWNRGAHLYKQPQCHQWTLVTVGQSPRFTRPAAQGLALRQGLSSILRRAGWGVGDVVGAPESDLHVGKGRDAHRL